MKYYLAVFFTLLCVQGFAQAYTSDADSSNEVVSSEYDDLLAAGANESEDAVASEDWKGGKHHHGKACAKVGLDATQKEQLKTAMVAFRKDSQVLRANIKAAKSEYRKVLVDAKSTRGAADTAGAAKDAAISKKIAAKTAFVNEVFYTILKADQRPAALQCLKSIKRHKAARFCKRLHHKHNGHQGHQGAQAEVEAELGE